MLRCGSVTTPRVVNYLNSPNISFGFFLRWVDGGVSVPRDISAETPRYFVCIVVILPPLLFLWYVILCN